MARAIDDVVDSIIAVTVLYVISRVGRWWQHVASG